MTPEQEERRGEDARRILDEAIYKESWTAVRENIVAKLEQRDLKPDDREHLNHLLVAIGLAKKYLEQVLLSGTMAAMETERKRTLAERVRDRLAA